MFYTQTNSKWSKEIMTANPGKWIDYLWRWGCLVSSLANICNDVMEKEFTPKDMNDLLVQINGYKFLNDQSTPENQASEVDWNVIKKYFGSTFDIDLYVKEPGYEYNENVYYVARVIHNKTGAGHYINVLSKQQNYICFDVEDGLVKQYKPSEITFMHKITYKG